ncbi:MAG: tautomerase family protein [Coriobacteriales bacterium]|nr:tautomerase family protein [Coriobacteriales bacterium]
MPIVRIDVQEGKSTAYKRAILHGVRRAVVFVLGVADERIMQRIIETPAEDIDITSGRTDSLTIIEIAMLAGRGADLKAKLFEAIVRELRFSPGIVASDIYVYVVDPPADCFCLGGTMPGQSKVESPGDTGPESSDAEGADIG